MKRVFFTSLLFTVLTACGGGGGAASVAPTVATASVASITPPACQPVKIVRIQLFGDSTQYGSTSGPFAGYWLPPDVLLQQKMDARFGSGAVVVTSRAVGGTSSNELVAGLDGLNQPWPRSVDADVVVMNHGINDAWYGTTPEVYRANLEKLAVASAIVVFETPLPTNVGHREFAPIMREVALAKNLLLIDANSFALSQPDWFTRYVADGIHPTGDGYKLLVNQSLFPGLDPVVARLKCL